ncbi:hypothetical protein GOB94_13885 [Granulicella sp. 5B5]|uniref:hypothetical protein n=1 Tax=Granulicella sp. 5B5 TaxID=1617967 RepID=UPI0015F6199B|nr:hypothetical protein [Granulicella sp. 5B5]QMV19658.1 hypothetical protein GOB94_13885 [Granulicella sp. 5B5]
MRPVLKIEGSVDGVTVSLLCEVPCDGVSPLQVERSFLTHRTFFPRGLGETAASMTPVNAELWFACLFGSFSESNIAEVSR